MTNCKELWFEADANLYSNRGAITTGVTNNTLDKFSSERIEEIIEKLKNKTYKFTPAKRVYIPKRTGKKKRPLGIPSGDDKLVGEVARILLERIYEPLFSQNSHGFRPRRSCHTALEQIQQEWTGVKWFIEFDISGFFDNLDHRIMIELLQKRIDDKRFIKLIKCMLKAGYLEDWIYHQTYSGTPQGGVASPILSNIYLHELDTFITELETRFTQGKRRRANPEYQQLTNQKYYVRKKIDKAGKKPDLIETLKELDRKQKALPSGDPFDEGYKRLRYCRYADDFLLGIIGTRNDATRIMAEITAFIEKKLKLQGEEGVKFLSYCIRVNQATKVVRTQRSGTYTSARAVTHRIRLEVPEGKGKEFCQKYGYGDGQKNKPLHRSELTSISDVEIIHTYNAELRGLANYYALANDAKRKRRKLEYPSNYSLFKTFAAKHKTKLTQIITRLKEGKEYTLQDKINGGIKEVKVFRLKHMEMKPKKWEIDEIPNTLWLTSPRSELVRRLNKEECEYCKQTHLPVESHHVKKLRDLKKKPQLKKWEKVMIARKRKTLILCGECHDLLHAGKLPDKRYRE